MPRERQLARHGEDADFVVGALIRWRKKKRRLRKVRPPREAMHLFGGHSLSVHNHCEWVAGEWPLAEDVELLKAPC